MQMSTAESCYRCKAYGTASSTTYLLIRARFEKPRPVSTDFESLEKWWSTQTSRSRSLFESKRTLSTRAENGQYRPLASANLIRQCNSLVLQQSPASFYLLGCGASCSPSMQEISGMVALYWAWSQHRERRLLECWRLLRFCDQTHIRDSSSHSGSRPCPCYFLLGVAFSLLPSRFLSVDIAQIWPLWRYAGLGVGGCYGPEVEVAQAAALSSTTLGGVPMRSTYPGLATGSLGRIVRRCSRVAVDTLAV